MDINFLFCGDTMLGRTRCAADPFSGVRRYIRAADISFCNLETSLDCSGEALAKRHIISTPRENLDWLVQAGFHIANLANNHAVDHGMPVCLEMIRELRKRNIEVAGLSRSGRSQPVILTRKGVKVGLLGYADYGFRSALMPLRPRIALADVTELRPRVDCVVVSLHWGCEYVEYPSPQQQRLARALVEAGVDLVIGHHPHVVQGIEEYRGGLIAYSLGNFQFRIDLGDEFLSGGTGIMLQVQRSLEGKLSYDAVPVRTLHSGQVECLLKRERGFEAKRLAKLSVPLDRKRIGYFRYSREASRLWLPSQLEAWFFRARRFGKAQWFRMLWWFCRPANLFCLLLYLVCPKHVSSPALFRTPLLTRKHE